MRLGLRRRYISNYIWIQLSTFTLTRRHRCRRRHHRPSSSRRVTVVDDSKVETKERKREKKNENRNQKIGATVNSLHKLIYDGVFFLYISHICTIIARWKKKHW